MSDELNELKNISAKLENIEAKVQSIRAGVVGSTIGRGEWMMFLVALLGLILWRVW